MPNQIHIHFHLVMKKDLWVDYLGKSEPLILD